MSNNIHCILTDLFPIYPNNEKYVSEQRQQTFQDLRRAVRFLKLDENATKEQVLHTMWTLETNRLPFGGPKPESGDSEAGEDEEHPFTVIARACDEQFPDAEPHQVYWIAKAVYNMTTQVDVDGLVAQTYTELGTFDKNLLRYWNPSILIGMVQLTGIVCLSVTWRTRISYPRSLWPPGSGAALRAS